MSAHRLANKIVLVTGSSAGIGRAIALKFAAEHARVVICADLTPGASVKSGTEANIPTHELIAQRMGGDSKRAIFVQTDVGKEEDMKACVEEATNLTGRLDVLVNNAGIGIDGVPIHQMSSQRWQSIIKANAYGTFLGCKLACTQFIHQEPDEVGRQGCIVNMASVVGLVGIRYASAYSASKAAVVSLTRSVAMEYAQYGVTCNALCPGFIRTALTDPIFNDGPSREYMKSSTPLPKDGKPSDVANAAAFLASNDSAWITGVSLPVDGGFVSH